MEGWAPTGERVKSVNGFAKQEIIARAGFSVLLENHRACEKLSAATSGISHEYT
jgi:hypothetical protein